MSPPIETIPAATDLPGLPPAIDTDRLLGRLDDLASIGLLDDGSCCRLALSDADREGRLLVQSWMVEAGLEVTVDAIGNLVGVQSGATMPPIMTGSHLDTVATGGRYDGAYGVIAGIEVLQTLKDAGIATSRPLAVAAFTNEEGVRFAPDMLGSMVFAGLMPVKEALDLRSTDGARLGDELERIGFAGSSPPGALRPSAFVELHIEQGPVLDRAGEALGVVTDLQGISWRRVRISGVSNHAGTTPMGMRHDAGYCAGRLAVFVRDLTDRMGGTQVGTVGSIELAPGLVSVIAREAIVTTDLRNTNDGELARAERDLDQWLDQLAQEEGVKVEVEQLVRTRPVVFDKEVVRCIESVAREMKLDVRRMTSGAGHDAQMIAGICPTAMIFVPSIGGISHNPREYTSPEHLEIGANALLRTMLKLSSTINDKTDANHITQRG